LEKRFTPTNVKSELKNRRRRPNESLQNLHTDIRRLAILAFPEFENEAREEIACDYFIEALNNPTLELALRERSVKHPDVALTEALKLELWQKRMNECQPETERQKKTVYKTRTITRDTRSKTHEAIIRKLDSLEHRNAQQRAETPNFSTEHPLYQRQSPSPTWLRDKRKCSGCKKTGHILCFCRQVAEHEKWKFASVYPSVIPTRCRVYRSDREIRTHIDIRIDGYPVRALLDTGSDVTIMDSELARKWRWEVQPTRMSTVKTASGEGMEIEGVCATTLSVGQKKYRTNIFVTPDMDGLVLGADWLSRKGKVVWDFNHRCVKFGERGMWILLRPERERNSCRVVTAKTVALPPNQETDIEVCIQRRSPSEQPREVFMEAGALAKMPCIYKGRGLLLARFNDNRLRILNTHNATCRLNKGSHLGKQKYIAEHDLKCDKYKQENFFQLKKLDNR